MDHFGRAGRSEPATPGRLRQAAEAILVELGTVSAVTGHWHALALGVRDQPAIIPSKGPPLFGGAKVHMWGQSDEVGHVAGPNDRTDAVPLRKAGELGAVLAEFTGGAGG